MQKPNGFANHNGKYTIHFAQKLNILPSSRQKENRHEKKPVPIPMKIKRKMEKTSQKSFSILNQAGD